MGTDFVWYMPRSGTVHFASRLSNPRVDSTYSRIVRAPRSPVHGIVTCRLLMYRVINIIVERGVGVRGREGEREV